MKKLGIFLGIGGDERAIRRLLPNDWETDCFTWPTPHKNESLKSYCLRPEARRMLRCDALLGFSFGALPVLELLAEQPQKPALLISCAIHRNELPWHLRLPGSAFFLGHCSPQMIRKAVNRFLESSSGEKAKLKGIVEGIPPELHQWAMLVSLHARYQLPPNTYRLHGESDPLFPKDRIGTSDWVPGGKHLLIRDSADEVRNWLDEKLHLISSSYA